MRQRNLYYGIKPFLPQRVRRAVRGVLARRLVPRIRNVWPILESAGVPPVGWTGWPGGKEFAFILTHDVESAEGVEKCRRLAELEMRYGFRSSFNFVPEGGYRVPDALRHWLTDNGFEVGVHDLHHDGKLFWSREGFQEKARLINRYLQEWRAVGFRSGFMLHNLAWHHDLDILYDASTFDTDPFEPQPDGVETIFPFFVAKDDQGEAEVGDRRSEIEDRRSEFGVRNSKIGRTERPDLPSAVSDLPIEKPRSGYVELPYTLAQDSTLFFLLKEKSPAPWMLKLDWIVSKGGMALLNTHPDYMEFGSVSSGRCFPGKHYENFLLHVASRFENRYWHANPRDLAYLVTSRHP